MPSRPKSDWTTRFLLYVSPILVAVIVAAVTAYYFRDRDQIGAEVASVDARVDKLDDRARNVEANVSFVIRDLAVLTALSEAERNWNRAQITNIVEMLRDMQRRASLEPGARPLPGGTAISGP